MIEQFLLGLVLGIVLTIVFEKILLSNKKLKKEFWDNHKSIFGYHFHHSTYGLIALLISLVLYLLGDDIWLNVLGVGLGIIFVHTITDKRLIFFEKSN